MLLKRVTGCTILVLILVSCQATISDSKQPFQNNNVSDWQIAKKAFTGDELDINDYEYPRFYKIKFAHWVDVEANDPSDVSFSKLISEPGESHCFLARIVFLSDQTKAFTIHLEHLEEIKLFMNKQARLHSKPVRTNIQNTLSTHHTLSLTANKGLNELFFIYRSTTGKLSLSLQTDLRFMKPASDFTRLERVWETDDVFATPESVVYDPVREVLYVSNFRANYERNLTDPEDFKQYISKLSLDGEILDLKWVDHLYAPCGMDIHNGVLYVVERYALVLIDIESAQVIKRYPIPESDFLNDLIIDSEGAVYMSDTRPGNKIGSRVYRFQNGRIDEFINDERIFQSNGLFIHNGKLIVGNSGDCILRQFDLITKECDEIISLGAGIQDGIRIDNQGNLIVSHWEGFIYSISPSGTVTTIFNMFDQPWNAADFEYVADKKLLIVPTFLGNRVVAYRLNEFDFERTRDK